MAMSLSDSRAFAERARAANSMSARAVRAVTETTGLTTSGLILAAVAVVAWGLGYFIAGRPLYLLSYGAAVVLALSWGIGRRPLPLIGERALVRARRREGEVIEMEVKLVAERRLSTFVLEEYVPEMLGQNARIPVASLEPGESVDHAYKLTCWRRGVYQLGPLVARWGDPFGFTERKAVLCEPFEFLVHPSTEGVMDRAFTRLWEDPPVRPPISKPWPSGMEFYGIREYAPGDDVRRVVWRAYARTQQLLVREAEQGITDQVNIILDTSSENHSKGLFSESFETGVRAAVVRGVSPQGRAVGHPRGQWATAGRPGARSAGQQQGARLPGPGEHRRAAPARGHQPCCVPAQSRRPCGGHHAASRPHICFGARVVDRTRLVGARRRPALG